MSSTRLLENAGSVSVDIHDLTVEFFQFLGIIILLVVACTHLLSHVVANRTQNLYVLVAFPGLAHLCRVI